LAGNQEGGRERGEREKGERVRGKEITIHKLMLQCFVIKINDTCNLFLLNCM
jgi:hypothetical protein